MLQQRVAQVTVLTLLLPLAYSAPSRPLRRDTTQIFDGSQVDGKTYDYVIAGGGLTGMVLASRLSEDSSRSVLVVEAGYSEESNPIISDASQYQKAFGTWIDWQYQTTGQIPNQKLEILRSGRALGGSTTINGLAWSKPHDFQIDAMEQLGNDGLNWNSLNGYMLRAENFQAPSSSQYAAGVTYNAGCHQSGGPLGVQYDPAASPTTLENDFNSTVQGLGLPYVTDLTCGNPGGAAPIANTRSGNTRNDAYRAYLFGKSRPNLTILSGANVGKVVLSSDSTPRATGIEFVDEKGNYYEATARLEVIMALGSIKTPIVLQQSGIGPSDVLASARVTQRVDLPVGLNLIDQTTTTTDWNFNANRGGGQPIVFPRFQDLVSGGDSSRLSGMLQNNLGSYAQAAVNAGAASSASGLQKVFEIQRDWILNQGAGISESFDYSFDTTLGYDTWYLLPFSRGSIKIQDNRPYANNFRIDPRYFTNDFDRLAHGATVRYTRTISTSGALDNDVTGETKPGTNDVPNGSDLDTWANWSENNYRSNWHPIGTAAMMSRDLGGCVDSRNKVYGVNGLRIVDGSTLPFQVSSHLMSVLYGLAERASDIIKQDNAGNTGGGSSSSSSASATPTSTSSTSASSTSASASATTTSAAQPSSTLKAIHPNGDNSKCLEVQGSVSNGALIQINDCNGSNNQQWSITRNLPYILFGGQADQTYCLDGGSDLSDGTKLKIWKCYSGLQAQNWVWNNDDSISNSGKCVDLTDGSKSNGNVVQEWQCYNDNNNQKWTVT